MKEETCQYEFCKYPGEPFDRSIHRLWKVTHHIDKDHENNDPKNLMQMHFGCHASLHNSGEKHPMFGRHRSEETRRKIGSAHRGKHHSEESKKKISESLKGRMTGENNPNYGKRFSKETKRRMSLAHTGKHFSEEHKRKISENMCVLWIVRRAVDEYREVKEDTCEYHDCKYPGEPFTSSHDKYRRTIHHIDGVHENNNPKNLMVVHLGCHASVHTKGKKASEESKKRMSEAKIGDKNPMYGKHLSEEHKRRLSKANRGKPGPKRTPEQVTRNQLSRRIGKENYAVIEEDLIWNGEELVSIDGISEERKRKINESMKKGETWSTGKHHSEEARRKISEALKGRTFSKEHKARYVLSCRIGRENYAVIEYSLFWDGEELVNIDEVMKGINC